MVEDPDDGLQPVDAEDLMMRPFVAIPENEVDEEEEPGVDDQIESSFDPRYREPFIGLLHLGALTNTVIHFGHKFRLVTPTQRERLEAGILHKRFANTISAEIAWSTLTVGLYLHSVDDQPLPEPIGPAVETGVQDRFNWVQDNLRPDVISRVFIDCLELDAKVSDTLDELEKSGKA